MIWLKQAPWIQRENGWQGWNTSRFWILDSSKRLCRIDQ
jgi:hypothetical protein